MAAEGGRVGTVESLLAKGADINIKDDKGVSGEAELDFFFYCWGGGEFCLFSYVDHNACRTNKRLDESD